MKLAINFPDNDFINTFKIVLEIFAKKYERDEKLPTDKRIIVQVINDLLLPVHILFNSCGDYMHDEYLRNYLRIRLEDVFIDDEVQQHIDKFPHCFNATFYVLDTHLIGYSGSQPVTIY